MLWLHVARAQERGTSASWAAHSGHMDYLVNGCLHFVHGDHCDEYGPVEVVTG